MARRATKRKNRVYEGRFKGLSEAHMPNDASRIGHDPTFEDSDSYLNYYCPNLKCSHVTRVHKCEYKVARCSKCGA